MLLYINLFYCSSFNLEESVGHLLNKFLQVNSAGVSGVVPDEDVLRAMNMDLVNWVR